jgi:hypothetical protein
MSVTQTAEIPANHRLVIDVPPEVPAGPVILTFTSRAAGKGGYSAGWQETLAVLKHTRGAWAANPWLTALVDIRADRDACAERDPWNDSLTSEDTGDNG